MKRINTTDDLKLNDILNVLEQRQWTVGGDEYCVLERSTCEDHRVTSWRLLFLENDEECAEALAHYYTEEQRLEIQVYPSGSDVGRSYTITKASKGLDS